MVTFYLPFYFFFFMVQPVPQPDFLHRVVDDSISIGYGLAIGDVDGDGKPDILLADKKQFVWYRNGDWKRFVMVDNLTEYDNVCIAARDIDGDGKVEVAVGAQWNPSETSDSLKSGSVHYLKPPADPTHRWIPVRLHHEPTVHRMRWVKVSGDRYQLIVVPLHGRGNANGTGKGVKIIAYDFPVNPDGKWDTHIVDESMHLTHNFDIVPLAEGEALLVGGKEGVKFFSFDDQKWTSASNRNLAVNGNSFGEVRAGKNRGEYFLAGIEPMHGTQVTEYQYGERSKRSVIASGLNQGHALALADLINWGSDQVIAGWREPDKAGKVGIKMFVREKEKKDVWKDFWIDENGMACEDLQVADLDGDGKKDIIASGRSTHNLKIYWNKTR
jgi:hypothetical protein